MSTRGRGERGSGEGGRGVGLRWGAAAVGRDLAARLGLLDGLQRVRTFRADRIREGRANRIVPSVLPRIPGQTEAWVAHAMLHNLSDVAILTAGPPQRPFEALIKIAETPAASEGLEWQRQMLTLLHADERLGDWRALLPNILSAGGADGTAYLVESRMEGTSLEHALRPSGTHDDELRRAAAAIAPLHRATAREEEIGEQRLDRWVSDPAAVLRDVAARFGGGTGAVDGLARLASELRAALEGRAVVVSWVHGDYGPGNILTRPDGGVSAIVDWEFSHPEDFPSLDIVTLVLTVRMVARRQELGRVVNELLANPVWSDTEAEIIAAAPDADLCAELGAETVILLCWLRHAAWMITRCSRYARSGLWVHANVHAVLEDFVRSRDSR